MTRLTTPSIHDIVVAIPCYNAQSTIEKTLENTLEQTYKDFRIFVYDDGSTDASPDIVKSFEDRDSRISLYRNERNNGRPHARNELLGLAPDALIAWQDADDLWHPAKLDKQVSFYEKMYVQCGHDAIALVSSLDRRKPQDETDDNYLSKILGKDYYRALHPPAEYDLKFVCSSQYMSFPFYLQSTFCRAFHFINAGGFDDRIPWYEDLDMGIKLLGSGVKIFGLRNETPLAYYFSGAPRLAPDIIESCLERIYTNSEKALNKSGIDIHYDMSLRKLTLFFLGMIRKREFGVARKILTQEYAYARNHSELDALLTLNWELLDRAIGAAVDSDIENQAPSSSLKIAL